MTKERSLKFPEPFLHRELKHPEAWHNLARDIVIGLYKLAPVFPAEVIDVNDSLTKTSNYIKEGSSVCGLGIHGSKREGPELLLRPASSIALIRKLPVVAPISLHQLLRERRLLDFLSHLTAVTTAPIVNRDAMRKKNRAIIENILGRKIKAGEGVNQYRELAGEVLRSGGFIAIAPQSGRRTSVNLDQATSQPIETLLTENELNSSANIAFLFMSMIPQGKVNYEEIYDHLNLRMKYKVVFTTFTTVELYSLLESMNASLAREPVEVDKPQITLDELILIILSLPFGPDYNKINPRYGDLLATIDNTGTMKDMEERGLFPPQVLE